MNKKHAIALFILCLCVVSTFVLLQATPSTGEVPTYQQQYQLSPDSNFFGRVENQTPVEIPANALQTATQKGYTLVSETDQLALLVKERYFQIAVIDKQSGYVWYSVYPDYLTLGYSGTSRLFIESGVVIEYYNLDNIQIEDTRNYSAGGSRYGVVMTYDYDSLDNGFQVRMEFKDQAIAFDVVVQIVDNQLVVSIPYDSIYEGQIEKPMLNLDGTTTMKITKYRLKGIFVFPYFGSNNFAINGYSFIPDGSGALIRYENIRYQTAYTKRIYGSDEGMIAYTSNNPTYYIRDEHTASMPIFGVNHGYKQAAFLAEMVEGDAYAEIHSYPYGYNSYTINTTFFKWILRERYSIQTSTNQSDSFQLIQTNPYPSNYQVRYHFLANEDASYSGMARQYRDLLDLDRETVTGPQTHLTLLAQDYKKGLFGKDFVVMTDYQDVITILQDLEASGLNHLRILYQGWNKGGYFNNSRILAIDPKLGGTSAFQTMMQFINNNEHSIYFLVNPLITTSQGLSSGAIKKITFLSFQTSQFRTSLFSSGYYLSPQEINQRLNRSLVNLQKAQIDSLALDYLGDTLFTYRDQGQNVFRTQTKDHIVQEMEQIAISTLAFTKPNSYLWKYTDLYLQAPIESNKYAFMSDSIPFVSMVLSGSARLSSPYYNYVSDYGLFTLRLLEYGIDPSFLITKESTHRLRYTNSAYVYTSHYDLWKDVIVSQSQQIQSIYAHVGGLTMMNHHYIAPGVAKVTYEGNIVVIINYTNTSYDGYPSVSVEAMSAKVVTS